MSNKFAQSTAAVIQIPTFSICIGTWRRVRPLTCFFSRNHRLFGWTMRSDSVGFKMECPYSSVQQITFNGPIEPSMSELAEQICEPLGLLCIRLHRPPMFNMQTFKSASKPGEPEPIGTTWRQCEDFTEGRQGTTSLTHILSGPFSALRDVVIKLRDSDADLAARLYMADELTHHFASQSGQGVAGSAADVGSGVSSFSSNESRLSSSESWMGPPTSAEEHGQEPPQLRLDQSYFDPSPSGNQQPMYYSPFAAHSAAMPPFDVGAETSPSMEQRDESLQVQRLSVASAHSAPSAYGLVGSNFQSGNFGHQGASGLPAINSPGGHEQGVNMLQGLGLSGVDLHADVEQRGSLLTPTWGQQPSHMSAPAAPEGSMIAAGWSPLDHSVVPQDFQHHQESYLEAATGGVPSEYPFYH